MKNKYTIQVIDLKHQVDHLTPKKIHLFEELNKDPSDVNARFFVILTRHRQSEMISYVNNFIKIKVI